MQILIIISLIFVYSSSQESSKSDIYKVIKTIESVEIREYDPSLYISYVNNEQENAQNSSFRVLADYIFGSNKNNEEIAMTSPVVIKLFNKNEMLFRIPKKYNIKNVPKPNNKNLKFVETKYIKKAVIQFSGYSNSDKEKKHIEELKEILNNNNIKHNNKFELFVYDPPYKFYNRRNEISVNIYL
ncbi:MAG: soul heme-binding protein [Flavobacteriales bacterium]|nr:soul heme-binding protein [Flavobacteriales bacterium]|tara:strand:+ start:41411 stop:41965 length:555 start_codon:yes stop_codon:yes gene_type:complete